MVDFNLVARLKEEGAAAWNAWREHNPDIHQPDLEGAQLRGMNLSEANLSGANLARADLSEANLFAASLSGANLNGAELSKANLEKATLSRAKLQKATLYSANLTGANLKGADFLETNLRGMTARRANLAKAHLLGADLNSADLREANLKGANLAGSDFTGVDLAGANLSGANLQTTILVDCDLTDADLSGCRIYGVSAWNVKIEGTKQHNLVLTPRSGIGYFAPGFGPDEPEITVDDIQVAQLVYLLLHNERIRNVIDTIGKKGVLLLGRFTEGRIQVLERLRDKLRSLGFLPMVFNFDKPETKDFTETVRLLANMSHFVIADITNPRAAPLELQATVPDYMVPFVPILEEGQEPFSMFEDLQKKYDWVLPVMVYPTVDHLIDVLDDKVIVAAQAKFNELLARRTKRLRVERI
jgi:uncharacterized protein YjbI with pentapeptide repeats